MRANSSISDSATDMRSVDVAIVGAGPVGLYGAFCAGFRELSTVLVDALPEVGGQVAAMYPEKLVYDVAGYEAVRGRDLVGELKAQSDKYGTTYLLGSPAQHLRPAGDGWVLETAVGAKVHTTSVIVTGGIGSFTPRPLPAAEGYEGRGLVYFVPRLEACRGQDVVIVGGGDSAFDWALALHPIARSVTLVHRRARFRAHSATVRAVEQSGVRIIVNAEISEVRGENAIEQVIIRGDTPASTLEVACQTLVAALGFQADLGPIESWGLQVVDRHLRVDTTMATNIPGIYAAGDIADYTGKVRLMSVGFGEVATAVNNAAVRLNPSADLFPGHSSDREVV